MTSSLIPQIIALASFITAARNIMELSRIGKKAYYNRNHEARLLFRKVRRAYKEGKIDKSEYHRLMEDSKCGHGH